MIIKGTSRSGPGALAAHLGNAEKNEQVRLLETRGTVAQDLRGALVEMDAYAAGTRCEKPLYHAAISPEPPHRLTPEQRSEAIDALEQKLGLEGHSRVVVMHEKEGREHIHIVWSRIDLERMRSVSDSHNFRRHEEVARDLERRFGHDRVQGAHHEREGVERPDRTPSRAELRQEEKTGITGKEAKAEVSALFRASDSPEAFKAALEEKGYALAKGDRRDFVIVDQAGGVHSLARRIEGVKAAELREFMAPIDRERLPTIEEVRRANRPANDPSLEKAYGRGEDYVSQSHAAQKDHERRQDALNSDQPRPQHPGEDRDSEGDHPGDGSTLRNKRSQEADEGSAHESDDVPDINLDNIEMTDAMRARLEKLTEHKAELGRSSGRGGPDRHGEAPGGGRSRGR